MHSRGVPKRSQSRSPVGIDPGWAHNVGKLNQRIHSRQIFIDKIKAWPEVGDKALEMRVTDFEYQGFKDFIANARAGYKTFWSVAAIPADRVRKMGLVADHPRVVDITPDTVSNPKHRQRFAQFTAQDWAMTDEAGKPWRIVVKKTSGELLLTTYHRMNTRGQIDGPGGA